MDDTLSLYKKYNRPEAQKLLQFAKSGGIQTTWKDVQTFISRRTKEQQLKESMHTKQRKIHRVSCNPFN
jgi:hypothetical protein